MERPATPTERILLEHLGFGPLGDDLRTEVRFTSPGIWGRFWPTLEHGTGP